VELVETLLVEETIIQNTLLVIFWEGIAEVVVETALEEDVETELEERAWTRHLLSLVAILGWEGRPTAVRKE